MQNMLQWLWGAPASASALDLIRGSKATLVIAVLTVAVFIPDITLAPWKPGVGQLTHALGLTPHLVANGQWWRLITPNFINPPRRFGEGNASAVQHLLFSMAGIVAFGPRLERS